MKEGPFSGSADRARFEREVQILGALQHPNIVTIHDSGQARGLFYLVMDYIPGQALDEYASNSRLKLREVLGLFVKVCEAVNAAHLRGIIHRDLKPSNIRVDPDGEPHILDFGLAKLTPGSTSGLTQADMMTMTGQFIGSLPWASPEQAEGRPERIDLRTDVYSLGVILYQLLTGRFPYQVIGSMRDVLDNILSAVPARPSSVRRQIGDEVETIVLKCLNKERERRYQTAGELARDVRHYLNGEPIEAKRDSTWYVLRKLARRHAYTSTVAACLLVIIVSSGLLSFFFYQEKRAALERDQKRAAADNLVQSLYQERAEGVHAQVRRMALGWFLLEWHADRLASAERILGRTTRGAPEAQVMTYLLEGVEDEAAFQAEMEAVRPGLGHFARGERLLKAGRSPDARAAFEDCLDARPDDWLQALAEARLEQLAPLATGARE
jgi:hypothetical protein